jgi:hypothetical protein
MDNIRIESIDVTPRLEIFENDGFHLKVIESADSFRIVQLEEKSIIELSGGSSEPLRFDFASPLATWTINHNLTFRPSAQFFTLGGMEIETEWIHISANQIQAFFNPPQAGFAIVN